VSGQFRAPAALPQEESRRCFWIRGCGGPYSWSGRGGEEKQTPASAGIRTNLL